MVAGLIGVSLLANGLVGLVGFLFMLVVVLGRAGDPCVDHDFHEIAQALSH